MSSSRQRSMSRGSVQFSQMGGERKRSDDEGLANLASELNSRISKRESRSLRRSRVSRWSDCGWRASEKT